MVVTNFLVLSPDSYNYLDKRPSGFRWGFDAYVYYDTAMATSGHAMSGSDFNLILAWCAEHWGEQSLDAAWVNQRTIIWVRDDNHAMEFKLRWL